MLFNSWIFVFAFLPVALAGFYVCKLYVSEAAAKAWLGIASFVFYGWWSAGYLLVLIASTVANFVVARLISQEQRLPIRRSLAVAAICANLALLIYFKYAGFFVETLNTVSGWKIVFPAVVLPLGISFFTFQKIAYIADVYGGQKAEENPINFLLFVSFFPQLIAGPIVHHRQILPQFAKTGRDGPDPSDLTVGLTLFSIGLFKKTILADPIGAHANLVFDASTKGFPLTVLEGWLGALAYAFQLYFDFSGYSDMAIGLARMFGIKLPLNFASPYRSTSIIEFWRHWHMTLSRFLRDYVYIPLGGNRRGAARRYVNLEVVMLVGGLWHGAGWTFVIWGGLHGLYLLINHAWHLRPAMLKQALAADTAHYAALAWLLTFTAVVVAWVFFRAASIASALVMLKAMIGAGLPVVGVGVRRAIFGDVGVGLSLLVALSVIAFLLPNSQTLLRNYAPALDWQTGISSPPLTGRLAWRPTRLWLAFTGCCFGLAVLRFSNVSEFIYFNF